MRHGVLGVLAEQFLAHAPDTARPAVAAHRLRQMRVQTLQQEILPLLPCTYVLLKGPSLSERLYGAPWQRSSRDLDLLVRPHDLEAVVAALQSAGFTETETSHSAAYARRHHHHITLTRAHTPPVEVHFRLLTGFGTALPAEEFLDRAENAVLSPEDEFLYLAVHAAQHLANRLIWLEDLRRLPTVYPALNWQAIRERAYRLHVRRALQFTLDALAGEAKLSSLFARLERSRLPEPVTELLSQSLLCDTPARAVRFASHHTARLARRRWQRWFPRLAPPEWAG